MGGINGLEIGKMNKISNLKYNIYTPSTSLLKLFGDFDSNKVTHADILLSVSKMSTTMRFE